MKKFLVTVNSKSNNVFQTPKKLVRVPSKFICNEKELQQVKIQARMKQVEIKAEEILDD